MRKALFLDRDGVINIDKKYTYKVDDFKFIKGIKNLIKKAKLKGYYVICITNQSGIARGYFKKSDFHDFMKYLNFSLKDSIGFELDGYYYCPHHPDGLIPEYSLQCNCRKPKAGLFELVNRDFKIDYENSIFIGDKITDLKAGEIMNIKNLFLYSQQNSLSIPKKYTHINSLSDVRIS